MNPNSPNILDRQKYAAFLKSAIDNADQQIRDFIFFDEDDRALVDKQKEYVTKLKIKLSNYDIYNQQVPYVCGTCGERDCACQFAGIRKMEMPVIEESPPEITQEDLTKFGI